MNKNTRCWMSFQFEKMAFQAAYRFWSICSREYGVHISKLEEECSLSLARSLNLKTRRIISIHVHGTRRFIHNRPGSRQGEQLCVERTLPENRPRRERHTDNNNNETCIHNRIERASTHIEERSCTKAEARSHHQPKYHRAQTVGERARTEEQNTSAVTSNMTLNTARMTRRAPTTCESERTKNHTRKCGRKEIVGRKTIWWRRKDGGEKIRERMKGEGNEFPTWKHNLSSINLKYRWNFATHNTSTQHSFLSPTKWYSHYFVS